MLLSFLFFLGCGQDAKSTDTSNGPGPEESDADADADADADSDADSDACTVGIDRIEPADGATDVELETTVTVYLTAPLGDNGYSLGESPPIAGTLAVAEDGMSFSLTPDPPLLESTAYTLTVEVCDTTATSTFTTRDPAPALELAGNAYVVDLNGADVTWVEPAGFGPVLMNYLIIDGLLIEVESNDESSIDTIASAAVATQTGFSQFVCIEPIDFSPAPFTGRPNFSVGPKDTMLSFSGYNVDTYALSVAGEFSEDGSGINDLTISGLADSRDINSGLGFDVCDLIPCVACPDGANACITLIIEDVYAPLDENIDIDPNINPADYRECSSF